MHSNEDTSKLITASDPPVIETRAGDQAFFGLLTAEDQRVLLERATRTTFRQNEAILEEGSRRAALFVLRKGIARVERAHLGRGIAVARLGPGAVFGEISFLEKAGASASVVAAEDVEVDIIEGTWVYSLLNSVPGLATRFYESLAVSLSHRLRETSALIPSLIVEDVPQVNRFHIQRASLGTPEQITPKLSGEVETFKERMLLADRAIKDHKLDGSQAQTQVSEACGFLSAALQHHVRQEAHLERTIGAYVFRETFPFFMQSVFADRSFTKPRGYAGDYYTIEVIYRDKAEGAGRLGPYIDRWALDTHPCRAVRNRRPMLTAAIRDLAARPKVPRPVRVTSLASGPARELFDLFTQSEPPDVQALCLDIDPEALGYAAGIAKDMGIAGRVTFAQENVVRLSQGRGKTTVPPQSLIYSVGLVDYLQDLHVVPLLDWIHDHLMPGGEVIIGNFDPSNPDKAYMDHILEWQLIHRSADHLRSLFEQSQFGATLVDVRREEAGVQLFAFCTKT